MSKGKKMNKKITISGYIRLADEDNEEKGVILSSTDEDYILLLDKKSEKLQYMIDEKVQISGTLSEDSEGNYKISVNSYESLNNDEDYDYDEDYHYRDDSDEEDEDY